MGKFKERVKNNEIGKTGKWRWAGVFVSLILVLAAAACSPDRAGSSRSSAPIQTTFPTGTGVETFNGFITSEDDFVDPEISPDPSRDSRAMLLMEAMARSGLGLAVHAADGWHFYYFSGNFATSIHPSFNGGGAQLDAWNILLNTKKIDHIAVTVTGFLDGTGATNPSGDADGLYYPVISVNTMVETQ
jgi:hypothetical protein